MKFSTEPDLDELITLVAKLPGLGPKSKKNCFISSKKQRQCYEAFISLVSESSFQGYSL